jgi:hypothetical protein
MKLSTKQNNLSRETIQGMSVGQVFRFGIGGASFEEDLVQGEMFMIIPCASGKKAKLDDCELMDTTRYVRLSGQFEYVSRTGPIYGYTVEDDLKFITSNKKAATLEKLSVGDGVSFDINDETYMIVTDPVDTTKMVSLMNLTTCELIKLSKETDCYQHTILMEVR